MNQEHTLQPPVTLAEVTPCSGGAGHVVAPKTLDPIRPVWAPKNSSVSTVRDRVDSDARCSVWPGIARRFGSRSSTWRSGISTVHTTQTPGGASSGSMNVHVRPTPRRRATDQLLPSTRYCAAALIPAARVRGLCAVVRAPDRRVGPGDDPEMRRVDGRSGLADQRRYDALDATHHRERHARLGRRPGIDVLTGPTASFGTWTSSATSRRPRRRPMSAANERHSYDSKPFSAADGTANRSAERCAMSTSRCSPKSFRTAGGRATSRRRWSPACRATTRRTKR